MDRVQAANGIETDLELALFHVDHGIRLRDSLAAAERAQRERPSIEADDARLGARSEQPLLEALRFSKRALSLGTRDAASTFTGMVERASPAVGGTPWFAARST